MAEKTCAPQVYGFFRLFVVFLYMVLFSNVHFQRMEKDWFMKYSTLPVSNKQSSLCRSRQHNLTSQLCSSPKETAPYNVMVVLCLWENPFSARHSIITHYLGCSLWRSPQNIPTSYLTIVTTPELLFWTSPKNICSIFVTFTKSDRRMKCTMLNYKE